MLKEGNSTILDDLKKSHEKEIRSLKEDYESRMNHLRKELTKEKEVAVAKE